MMQPHDETASVFCRRKSAIHLRERNPSWITVCKPVQKLLRPLSGSSIIFEAVKGTRFYKQLKKEFFE